MVDNELTRTINASTTSSGARLSVSVSGTLAVELRRIANNLNVEPGVIARELIREGLANKYGITTR
jgi:IS30 family transposase